MSIIITCHNYGKYLERCIKSALNQTYHPKEIIVINDGSTDNTLKVIEKYENKIKSIHNLKALGCGTARDQGLEKSEGPLSLFLDADDELLSNYLEETAPYLQDQTIGFVYCSFYQIKGNAKTTFHTIPYNPQELSKENYISITSLTRKNLIQKIGGFDNRLLIQDYDLWGRMTHITKGQSIEKPLFIQYFHGKNMNTSMPQKRKLKDIDRIHRRIKLGFLLYHRDVRYLITKNKKHSIGEQCLKEMGFDQQDLFEVEKSIIDLYETGQEISSLKQYRTLYP